MTSETRNEVALPKGSIGTAFRVLCDCPVTDGICWHSPPCPVAAISLRKIEQLVIGNIDTFAERERRAFAASILEEMATFPGEHFNFLMTRLHESADR